MQLFPSSSPTPFTGQKTSRLDDSSDASSLRASERTATDERTMRRASFANSPFSQRWRASVDTKESLRNASSMQTNVASFSGDNADEFVCSWANGLQLSESWTDEQCLANLTALYTELKGHVEIAGPRCDWDARMKAVSVQIMSEKAKPVAARDAVLYAALQRKRVILKAATEDLMLAEEDFQRWEERKAALQNVLCDMSVSKSDSKVLMNIDILLKDLQRLHLSYPDDQTQQHSEGTILLH